MPSQPRFIFSSRISICVILKQISPIMGSMLMRSITFSKTCWTFEGFGHLQSSADLSTMMLSTNFLSTLVVFVALSTSPSPSSAAYMHPVNHRLSQSRFFQILSPAHKALLTQGSGPLKSDLFFGTTVFMKSWSVEWWWKFGCLEFGIFSSTYDTIHRFIFSLNLFFCE